MDRRHDEDITSRERKTKADGGEKTEGKEERKREREERGTDASARGIGNIKWWNLSVEAPSLRAQVMVAKATEFSPEEGKEREMKTE